ncbi:MAG: orotidine 5'-phosphate decarboxylase, partial [Pusillimonas sp.]|nr:orotidine 5'-phosphate decarboxylase [Pusillimonas sp.]
MKFTEKLNFAWQHANSQLVVGLDPDPRRFPAELHGKPDAIFEFCKAIVDSTAPHICGVKPQIAYFASQRAEAQLEALCQYI